jgi:RNase P/RNase MRP subunit p29
MRTEYIEGVVIRETDSAVLLETDDGKVWVPKSIVIDPPDYWGEDEEVEIEIPTWFAEKEGLV